MFNNMIQKDTTHLIGRRMGWSFLIVLLHILIMIQDEEQGLRRRDRIKRLDTRNRLMKIGTEMVMNLMTGGLRTHRRRQ